MILDQIRLTLRLGRFEYLAFGAAILLLSIGTILSANALDAVRPAAECFGAQQIGTTTAECDTALQAWYNAQNAGPGIFYGLLLFVSFAAGLFLGVPIIAREIERGTSRLAWSLAPSRMRWFLARMLPALLLLGVLTLLAGFAMDRYASAVSTETDLSNSFTQFGYRGVLIASRPVFIFAIGVTVGAIVGRALPAVILSAIVAGIGIGGGQMVHQRILEAEAVEVPTNQDGNGVVIGGSQPGDMYINQRFRLPDGSLVGYEYFSDRSPFDDQGLPLYPMIDLVIPGERYRFVETREALALAGGSLVVLVLAGFVVSRRRPG
jgi:hypothetical protein